MSFEFQVRQLFVSAYPAPPATARVSTLRPGPGVQNGQRLDDLGQTYIGLAPPVMFVGF